VASSGLIDSSDPLGRLTANPRPFNGTARVSERAAANGEILLRLSRGIEVQSDPSLGKLVRPSDAGEPIQRWFRYREGYTAELCRRLFDGESFVIDPFCGFGSTLVAARGVGVRASGLDVSPLAVFVSRVKTRRYSRSAVRSLCQQARQLGGLTVRLAGAPPPPLRILHKLFHPEILHALLIFRAAIDRVVRLEEREFLLLAWAAILEQVSNVYREGNGVKYRNRTRRGNTYSVTPYEEWQAERFPSDKFAYVRSKLLSQLDLMIGEADLMDRGPEPVIRQADASNAAHAAPKEGASLIMFSPPYCNCFNYIKAYKLELWMAGFIRAYPDIKLLTAMGVRSRTEALLDPVIDPYPAIIEDLVAVMDPQALWSPQLPDVVRGYFADMQRILSSLVRGVRKGGRCIIVVGNSAYGGVLVPSDLLLAQMARLVGFEIEKIVVTRHLTTSSQQRKGLDPLKEFLRESIIHLRREK
jgi:SAM-dependent methyltransferase